MSALERLLATHAPLEQMTAQWRDARELDLTALEELHREATVAAHEHYCSTIQVYGALAEDLDLVGCRDADVIRAELASTDDLFKSYDEAWLDERDFDKMTRWLQTIFSGSLKGGELRHDSIASWLSAMESAGAKVWFSSGTSGHLSFVPRDHHAAAVLERQVGLVVGPLLGGHVLAGGFDAILLSFAGGRQGLASAAERIAAVAGRVTFLFDFALTPDGVRAAAKGDMNAAAQFRRRTVEELPERQGHVIDALRSSAREARPALVLGAPFQLADLCRRLEAEGQQIVLAEGSTVLLAGGWKSFAGEQIPRSELTALVAERLGVSRLHEAYGMTECSMQMLLCEHERFHVPPTLWPMVMDDTLLPKPGLGRGRFGFSDPLATSFPSPFISGDEVELTVERCACGRPGFSFLGEISRAAGREVKGCGGVMASVRG